MWQLGEPLNALYLFPEHRLAVGGGLRLRLGDLHTKEDKLYEPPAT